MTLTCEELVDLLVDYLGGELPDEQVDAIKSHVCGCGSCGVYIETYQLTITVTRALPRCEAPLPPSCEARLRAALGL